MKITIYNCSRDETAVEIRYNNESSYIDKEEIIPNVNYYFNIGYREGKDIDDYFYARIIRILLLTLATR